MRPNQFWVRLFWCFWVSGRRVGESQATPTLCPDNRYEGWGKDGRKAGKARQGPPYAHATCMKGGERVVERWGKPGNPHPMPMQQAGRVGKRWSKDGGSPGKQKSQIILS